MDESRAAYRLGAHSCPPGRAEEAIVNGLLELMRGL
jgi:hypothetical protein